MKRILFILILLLAAAAGAWYFLKGARSAAAGTPPKATFTTAPVTRGSVLETVAATGTIEPLELIDIGSQVSGKILAFGSGADGKELDYCSVVTNGMVLARIDDTTYVADLNCAKAQVQSAQASVAVAKANLLSALASLKKARREWERAQKTGVGVAISQANYDSYEAAYESAKAAVSVAEANILSAEAQVVNARASLEKAERNLSYCTITSPVDGVVIDRRVNVGQTVVSSMSVSSLFLVARDLKKVSIWVAVNEADVGSLAIGTPVSFTVDALPDRTFHGKVARVRLNATVTSNVVTYTVEVETDNSDGSLLPFLTANVLFETKRVDDALVVPAKALRFKPDGAPPPPSGAGPVVFVEADGAPRPVPVEVLLDNGSDVAVSSPELSETSRVITSMQIVKPGKLSGRPDAPGGGDEKNPFMPNMPKPRKGRAGPPPH